MEKEIDLRALITNNLHCDSHDLRTISLSENETINLIERPFENTRKWSKIQETSYIESIFLHCSLQPIIRFKNNNHTVIVDGYNRYMAIKKFYNNELKLNKKGLKQLKFLENKTYSDLTEKESEYFSKCDPIKVLDYSYYNKATNKEILDFEEEIEIEKYLYVIYNTGLRLEIEEIQNAEFNSDVITNKIKKQIVEDENFMTILESLNLYNGKRKRNKIKNILLNCRLLIASTYSNIHNFYTTSNIETRIDENYLPNIIHYDMNKIYQEFLLNINQIYNNLVNTQKWHKYPMLNTKPFFEATYWLISVIRKDKLSDPLNFDFMKYIEYFGEKEEIEKNFTKLNSHFIQNMHNKYYVVAKYYEKEYGINMSSYFKEEIEKNENIGIINSIDELQKKHYTFNPETIKVSDMVIELKKSSYNLRPSYQRAEVMNTELSSKIIESLLLGIEIPYILMCDKYENDKIITEVVDGQQRLLSILGYLGSPFMNNNKELEYSNKNEYQLKNLRILNELNGYAFSDNKQKKQLRNDYKQRILDSYLYISKTRETNDSEFNTIDHFVRLNKNICTLKEHTYRMLSLTCDSKIIQYAEKITKDVLESLFKKISKKDNEKIVTLRLARLFYEKDISRNNYNNNRTITQWLNEFNKFKDANINKDIEAIKQKRNSYYTALDEVKQFYTKIIEFLNKINKEIREILNISNRSNISLINYYYLFYMLKDISKEDLLDNSNKIEKIIKEFFIKIREDKLDNTSIEEILKFTTQQISIFNSSKRYEFKEHMNKILNNVQN